MDDAKFETQKKRELTAAITESRSETGKQHVQPPGLELINEVFINNANGSQLDFDTQFNLITASKYIIYRATNFNSYFKFDE